MTTAQELQDLNEARRILQENKLFTNTAKSLASYAKLFHAEQWVNKQIAALLAE